MTVKGKEDEQTVRELQKPFHDHFGLTRPRPKYDNADHELVSNILASLDLVLNMMSQAANSHMAVPKVSFNLHSTLFIFAMCGDCAV